MNIVKPATLALFAAAALSAHAVSIGLTSLGSTQDGFVVNDGVLAQVGGFGPLSTLRLEVTNFDPNPIGGTFAGMGTYTGTGGTLDFTFRFGPSISTASGTETAYIGDWMATGGTGTYRGATGDGVLTENFFDGQNLVSKTFTTFSGSVQAVPEPSALAALGLPALALLRRRKRG